MKKALIALSIAAGMVGAAQAENTTTLYGNIGYDVKVTDIKDTVKGDSVLDLNTAAARMGVKGTEDLNNGLQAFYKLEFNLEGNELDGNEIRFAYLGLKGNFGTLTLGKQDSIYNNIVDVADPFNTGDEWYRFDGSFASRPSKVVSYVSPEFSGFHFGISGIFDGDNVASKGVDGYEAGVWYESNGFYAGLAYQYGEFAQIVGQEANREVIGGALKYSNDQYMAAFNIDHVAGSSDDLSISGNTNYNLAGEYYYGPHTFRAGIGYTDADANDADILGLGLGYQYNFSKRTYTWVEASYLNYDRPANSTEEDDGYTVTVGIRHDF